MPKVTTVEEVLQSESGQIIACVKGRLKVIWDRESKEGQYGEYTYQNGVLADGENEVRLHIKNHDEIPKDWKGKLIWITAGRDKKDKLSGVEFKADTDNDGKERFTLMVGKVASIVKADGPPPEARSSGGPRQPSLPVGKADPQVVWDSLHRFTTLADGCLKVAVAAVNKNAKVIQEIGGDPGAMAQAITSTLLITALEKRLLDTHLPGMPRVPKPTPKKAQPDPEEGNEPDPDEKPAVPGQEPGDDSGNPEDWGDGGAE